MVDTSITQSDKRCVDNGAALDLTDRANQIIAAVAALKTALQQASAADRACAVILASEDLISIYQRAASDYDYFAR
ncbi:MAG TPA: hypothetical protein VH164_15735, partial [Ktedonobacteraceae bacterium]|nr:hypothetical protein [Ktedonobacteraceae bacterium]